MKKISKPKRNWKTYDVASRATKVRGGFVNPSFARKHINKAVEKTVTHAASGVKDHAYKMLSDLASDTLGVKVDGATIQRVAEGALKADSRPITIAETTESISGRRDSGQSLIGRKYKTTFHAGQKPTRSVRLQEKIGGTKRITQSDTATSTLTTETRHQLTAQAGFNQKLYKWYNDVSHWVYGDIETLLNTATFSTPNQHFDRAYVLSKWFGVTMKMMNISSYSPVIVKVHWLKMEKLSSGFSTRMTQLFNDSLTVQELNRLPLTLQQEALEITGAGQYVTVDPVLGNFTKVLSFKDLFVKVKTHTKRLQPGESWEIDYKHFTGPGIRLNEVVRSSDVASTSSIAAPFYAPVIEIKGVPARAYKLDDKAVSHMGTSPVMLQCEFAKTAEFTLPTQDQESIYNTANEYGYKDHQWAMKVYSDRSPLENSDNKRFFIQNENIVPIGEDPTGKPNAWVVPVSTDTSIASGGQGQ